MKDKDTVSIITICFNNKEELLSTLNSVDMQKEEVYEHIIVDGSTNDEIKTYLESNQQPSYRKWVCESDKGISDAFNKGISKATGTVINMLNSGDTFYNNDVLEHVNSIFEEQKDVKWMHSKYITYRGGKWIYIGKPFELSKLYRGMRRVCHQTMFVKKELYDTYGHYDLDEKISMDYDFLCRIAKEPFYFSTEVFAKFIPDGISSTQYVEALYYQKKVYEKYFPAVLKTNLWILRQRFLYSLLNSPIGDFLFSIKKALKLENW